MLHPELARWESAFRTLHQEIEDYEETLRGVLTQDPNARSRSGTGQLISFQLARLIPLVMEAGTPTEGSPEAVLLGRYTSKLTLLNVEPVPPFEQGRAKLLELTSALADTSASWAADGVDSEVADAWAQEVKSDAELIQEAADRLNS